MYPTIRDFLMLHNGVDTLDASTGENFKMKAYIVAVIADMPARDTVMGLAGYNSRHYCNYCNVRGCSGATRSLAVADRTAKQKPGPAENEDSDPEDADVLPPSAAARIGRVHIYCPLTPPADVPRDDDWREYYPMNYR